jgi:hypothetical protein
MPRKVVVEPPKQRKALTRAYLLGSLLVLCGYWVRLWTGSGLGKVLIVVGVLVFIGSIVARIFMNWMDKPN